MVHWKAVSHGEDDWLGQWNILRKQSVFGIRTWVKPWLYGGSSSYLIRLSLYSGEGTCQQNPVNSFATQNMPLFVLLVGGWQYFALTDEYIFLVM